jgi:hypothetical protein
MSTDRRVAKMPRDEKGRLTLSTLGDLIDGDFTLAVCCAGDNCNNHTNADLEALAKRYGRDQGSMHADLVKLPWRCELCGSRKVTFRLIPKSKDARPQQLRDMDELL